MDDARFPSGIAIFGSDDAEHKYFMLYFDERGVSRKYDVSVGPNEFSWRRDDADFAQRVILAVSNDGKTIVSKGEMNRDGKGWEPDLELIYTRV